MVIFRRAKKSVRRMAENSVSGGLMVWVAHFSPRELRGEGMTEREWALKLKKLSLHIARQLPRKLWSARKSGRFNAAAEAEDLLQDAVKCALERKHEWQTLDGPDHERLDKIMYSRVSHRIAGLIALHESKNVPLDEMLAKNPDARELSTEAEGFSQYGMAPGTLLFSERAVYVSEVEMRAHRRLHTDDECLAVFERLWHGMTKPQEIAADMGISVEEVNLIKRRIARKLGAEFEDLQALYGRESSSRRRGSEEE